MLFYLFYSGVLSSVLMFYSILFYCVELFYYFMIFCSKLNSILCSVWISILSCPILLSCVVWCSALRWCDKFYSILSGVLLYFFLLWWAEFYSAFYSIRFFCGVLSSILFRSVILCSILYYCCIISYLDLQSCVLSSFSIMFLIEYILCFLFYWILFNPMLFCSL